MWSRHSILHLRWNKKINLAILFCLGMHPVIGYINSYYGWIQSSDRYLQICLEISLCEAFSLDSLEETDLNKPRDIYAHWALFSTNVEWGSQVALEFHAFMYSSRRALHKSLHVQVSERILTEDIYLPSRCPERCLDIFKKKSDCLLDFKGMYSWKKPMHKN